MGSKRIRFENHNYLRIAVLVSVDLVVRLTKLLVSPQIPAHIERYGLCVKDAGYDYIQHRIDW
jgi:hypothetical protein